ncbi:MAG: ABC transporter permease [Ilumatobacteraceae bacterium]
MNATAVTSDGLEAVTTDAGQRPPNAFASIAGRALPTVLLYIASICAALGLCAILVSSTGGSATQVFSALLDGSLRSAGAWGLTISTATPLLVVAVGTIVGAKAGMDNIGQEGQLLLGAGAAAFVATRLDLPGPLLLLASFLAAAAIGGLWAGLAAVMKFTRKVPEVISTLLLIFIASQVVTFSLTKKWLLRSLDSTSRTNNGEPLPQSARLPGIEIFGNVVTWGAVVALVMTLLVGIVLARTTIGFKLRVLGLNPRTARRFGVSAIGIGGGALIFSGAAAGLAGGLWLTGGSAGDRFTGGISSNIGWQGLLVALLARQKVSLAVTMAFVFAGLRTGSQFVAATGVDRRITDVIQAMLVLSLLIPPAIQSLQGRRRRSGVAA